MHQLGAQNSTQNVGWFWSRGVLAIQRGISDLRLRQENETLIPTMGVMIIVLKC